MLQLQLEDCKVLGKVWIQKDTAMLNNRRYDVTDNVACVRCNVRVCKMAGCGSVAVTFQMRCNQGLLSSIKI